MSWDASALISNSWFSLFLAIISVLSFIGMFYFYYKSKKEKFPLYSKKSTLLLDIEDLSEKYEPLQITYKNNKIKILTVTQVSFWNCGRDPILKSDIATKDPLIIKAENNAQILDVKIITPDNNPNGFEYKMSDNLLSFTFAFDYINKNQGAIIQLLHTGKSSDNISLDGIVIGFGKPKLFSKQVVSPNDTFVTRMFIKLTNKKQRQFFYNVGTLQHPILSLLLGIFFLYFLYEMVCTDIQTPDNTPIFGYGVVIGLVLLFGGRGLLELKKWIDVQTSQIPVDLDVFIDEIHK